MTQEVANVKEVLRKLGAFRRVENMRSSRGNDIANQFILYFEKGQVFQSYSSLIVIQVREPEGEKVYLTPHWNYSRTTSKYRNQFLCDISARSTEAKIKSGEYVLTDEVS